MMINPVKLSLKEVLDKAATLQEKGVYRIVEALVSLGVGFGRHRFTFDHSQNGIRFFDHTGIDDCAEIISETELMKFYGKGSWWMPEDEL